MVGHPRWGHLAEECQKAERCLERRGRQEDATLNLCLLSKLLWHQDGLHLSRSPLCHCSGVNPNPCENGGGKVWIGPGSEVYVAEGAIGEGEYWDT